MTPHTYDAVWAITPSLPRPHAASIAGSTP